MQTARSSSLPHPLPPLFSLKRRRSRGAEEADEVPEVMGGGRGVFVCHSKDDSARGVAPTLTAAAG